MRLAIAPSLILKLLRLNAFLISLSEIAMMCVGHSHTASLVLTSVTHRLGCAVHLENMSKFERASRRKGNSQRDCKTVPFQQRGFPEAALHAHPLPCVKPSDG